MTNEELQDAINMANAMAKAAGQGSPRYQMLLDHMQALLKEQQRRATERPDTDLRSDIIWRNHLQELKSAEHEL